MNPSARKSGLLALGFLENVQQQKIRKAPPVEGASIASTAPPSSPTVNVSQEIIKCLPQNLRFSVPLSSGQLQLCDSPWDVKNQNDRDEIRWGLISLAQTGSKDAQEVLENLKDDSAESTSRQAFVRELINLHKNASMENGLLCLNEPENPVCQ